MRPEALPLAIRHVYCTSKDSDASVDLPFLGSHVDDQIAVDIALGKMDPVSKVRVRASRQSHHRSYLGLHQTYFSPISYRPIAELPQRSTSVNVIAGSTKADKSSGKLDLILLF